MKIVRCTFPLLFALAALLVRLPELDTRPIHTDEAVNAFILEETLSAEGYHYRTHDHHGPLLFQLTATAFRAAGLVHLADFQAWHLRLVPALLGAGLAGAAWFFRPGAGRLAAAGAAFFLSFLSPLVYYGGIYIHETLLLVLMGVFIGAFLRWRETPSAGSALLGGLAAGLMLATKETAAPLLLLFLMVFLPGTVGPWRRRRGGLGLAFATALVVVLLCYSDMGRHPGRALDLFGAVGRQVGRGLGTEHAYPWWQYLRWFLAPAPIGLPWGTWLMVILAGVGLWSRRNDPFTVRLAIWAAAVFIFHCFLSYKTPWLMLVVLLPLAWIAGEGVQAVWTAMRTRSSPALAMAGMFALVWPVGAETWSRCFRDAVSPHNPIAYSPSSPDLARLEHDLDALGGRHTRIYVIAKDVWPLPWNLRRFSQTGFWSAPPESIEPGVLLIGPEQAGRFADRAPFRSYELRPGVRVFLTPLIKTSFHP